MQSLMSRVGGRVLSRLGQGPGRAWSSAWRVAGAVAVGVLALGGCSTTALPPREVPVSSTPDTADAERRARSRLDLASAYFSRGQLDTALEDVKLALQIAPGLPEAWNLRGLVYAAMGEDRLADESFRQALTLRPQDGATLHNRAWFSCQRGQYEQAQTQFEATLAVPQYRDVLRTLLARGVCYARAGDWGNAERTLMRAYEIDPSSPGIGFSLAEVLYRRQDFQRARFYIGRVNGDAEASNAQSLWLAIRIDHKLGQEASERALGQQLTGRYPKSPEAVLYEGGRFDD